MTWRGYAQMADAVLDGLERAIPERVPPVPEPLDGEALAPGLGLSMGGNVDQVLHIMGQAQPPPPEGAPRPPR